MRLFLSLILATLAIVIPGDPAAAQSVRHVLTSVEQNIDLENWQITARDTGVSPDIPWSVRRQRLHGGKQDRVDLIVIDNGRLTITVVPTRGMGILRVVMGDLRLGWDSPVREVVHPKYVNLEARGGLGWLEGFNEWLARCGLEWAGHPGPDRFINNVGEQAEMNLTLHGKVENIPASEVEVIVEREPRPRIRVRGRVDERAFYGPKLELWTELSTEPGSSTFRIEDTLTNRSAFESEFQIIYHVNYGPPLLGAGAHFSAPVRRVTPFNAHAAKDVATYADYAGPVRGFIEQVYNLHPFSDREGRSLLMLSNASRDRGVSMGFAVAELPYVTLWKNLTALEEGYVTGLEPGTGFPYPRRLERDAGRVPKLKPGETRRFAIDFGVHATAAAVATVEEQIKRIQDGRSAQIDRTPER
ncbi:MAG TPA: aldose 1-epimerase family protein [Vicinamibacterales bacterium]|nr:aldose 1-epimerase family protein [Vicinamibacterales bacterium]